MRGANENESRPCCHLAKRKQDGRSRVVDTHVYGTVPPGTTSSPHSAKGRVAQMESGGRRWVAGGKKGLVRARVQLTRHLEAERYGRVCHVPTNSPSARPHVCLTNCKARQGSPFVFGCNNSSGFYSAALKSPADDSDVRSISRKNVRASNVLLSASGITAARAAGAAAAPLAVGGG